MGTLGAMMQRQRRPLPPGRRARARQARARGRRGPRAVPRAARRLRLPARRRPARRHGLLRRAHDRGAAARRALRARHDGGRSRSPTRTTSRSRKESPELPRWSATCERGRGAASRRDGAARAGPGRRLRRAVRAADRAPRARAARARRDRAAATCRSSARAHDLAGIILSGGPATVYAAGRADDRPARCSSSGVPVLGICYGMQLIAHAARRRGRSAPTSASSAARAIAIAATPTGSSRASAADVDVWMSHGDQVERLAGGLRGARARPTPARSPPCATRRGRSTACSSTPRSRTRRAASEILRNFLFGVCGLRGRLDDARRSSSEAVAKIRAQVGADGGVICGLSGGVDSLGRGGADPHGDRRPAAPASSSTTACCGTARRTQVRRDVPRALPDRPARRRRGRAVPRRPRGRHRPRGEAQADRPRVRRGLRATRRSASRRATSSRQGTLYPDVIESATARRHRRRRSRRTTTSAACPRSSGFELRRAAARALQGRGARDRPRARPARARSSAASRSPGPGLAVRIVGEVTPERLAHPARRRRDRHEEIERAGALRATLAVLRRAAARADGRRDGRRAHLRERHRHPRRREPGRHDRRLGRTSPHDLLARISATASSTRCAASTASSTTSRSKPPATIEWE